MNRPVRIPCLLPHCGCTVSRERLNPAHDGWICAKHWRGVSRALKACYRRARAAERTATDRDRAALLRLQVEADAVAAVAFPVMHPAEAERWRTVDRHVRASARGHRLWRACRRKAIEAAGGIG